MSVLDGFAFWIGKLLAEVAVAFGAIVVFVLIVALLVWLGRRHR